MSTLGGGSSSSSGSGACNIQIFMDKIVYVKLEIEGETRRVEGPTRQVESCFSNGIMIRLDESWLGLAKYVLGRENLTSGVWDLFKGA